MTTTCIIFSDELQFLSIKPLMICSIIVAHKSVEKANTPIPSGVKAIIKRWFWFAISNAHIIQFSRSS